MNTNHNNTLDEYAMTFIRLKARTLVGKYGFNRSDREDIEQELTLDLLPRLSRYDLRKARSATFVRLVVDRRVASLIRKRQALMRDYRRATQSLDDLIAPDDNDNAGERSYDDQEQRELAIDVADALAELSDDLRIITEALRDGSPLAEVAREQELTREALRWRVRKLREHFKRRGLGESVEPTQSMAHRVSNQ